MKEDELTSFPTEADAAVLLRELLDAIPTYTYRVVLTDGHATATEHSPGARAITGYGPNDYLRQPSLWIDMVHPDDREMVLDCFNRITRGDPVRPIEHRIAHRDGTTRWIRNTVVPHYDHAGKLAHYDGLIEDITQRKEAEIALECERKLLETHVAERTKELSQLVTRLKEQDAARTEFVSNVSHELKTPLASMRYAIENLLRGVTGELSDKTAAYLRIIRKDCDRLDSTIADVLDLSRIEAKAFVLKRTPIDLRTLVQQVLDDVAFLLEEKRMHLQVRRADESITASCDAERIRRAVLNIVRNAIKFTPEEGCIRVVLERRDHMEPAEAVIRVTDNGIGIPPQHLGRVTTRYYRVDERVHGTGLGLAICSEIVELHGGRMEIESPPSGGSSGTEVRMYIPLTGMPQP